MEKMVVWHLICKHAALESNPKAIQKLPESYQMAVLLTQES